MDFRQMSSMLSSKVTQQIIEEHHQKVEDLSFLLDREFLLTLWSRLTQEERNVIRFFLLHMGSDLLTYREIEQGSLPIPKAAFRKGLTMLRRKGMVFTLRRLWGELAYFMPQDLVSAIRGMLVSYEPSWESSRHIPSTSSYHIINGIYQVLNLVRNNSIELNKKGTLQRKDLRTIYSLMGLSKEMLAFFKPLEQVIHPYEHHEALILDWLTSLQLLQQCNNRLCIGKIERLFHLATWEGHVQFLLSLREYLPLDQRLDFLYDLMVHLPADRTYSLKKMTDQMADYAPAIHEVLQKILTPLANLGLISYSHLNEEVLWSWKFHSPLEYCPVYVQPNFEILVPQFATIELKWSLGEFADLRSQEEMWVFTLTRDSIRRAMDRGKNVHRILEELEELEGKVSAPIPENVVNTIRQWEREYQRIQFYDMRVMEVSDAELASQLEKIPAISTYFIQRLGECFFAVRTDNWSDLILELERRGYTPGLVPLTSAEGDEITEPLKIFKNAEHKLEYKVESVFPDLEDAIPGIRDIPRMWTANFQPYHGSTLRDLVQKAIQMGLGIKVQYRNEICQLSPSHLLNKDGNWMVQVEGPSTDIQELCLDHIQKIQVIIP